jgi:hypothetical protein
MSQETGSYPLNSQQAHEFSNFHALLTSWAGAYPFSMISYVSVKTAKGPRLLFGRILLLPCCTLAKDTPFRFETEHILAARFVSDMTAADVAQSLEKAKTGQFPAVDDATTIELERDGNFSVYFDAIGSRFFSVPEGRRSPCLQLLGISIWTLLSNSLGSRPFEQLDWELRAADKPFENLDGLLSYCGLPTLSQIGDSTMFEIVASPPGWIGNGSTIENGKASIECFIAAALDIEKIKLGYESLPKDSRERSSINGSMLEWRREGDVKIGTYRTQVGETPELQAFLSYESFCLHQLRVRDPQKHLNPRYAIHQVFDKDMVFLEDVLTNPKSFSKPKSNKAKEFAKAFEGTISTLCYLLGFSVVNYGRIKKLQQGPDIIVVSPTGNIGVIECTVGLLNENDKLDKLVQRTTLIKEELASAGYGHLQLQPAIVTRLSRDEVAANLKIAEEHGIAVICEEEIKKLLDQVSLPPEPERIFQDMRGLVPGVNKDRIL